jgi:2,4-dienoyl-CoA reductase [(3E)-enoyl-CoA-producing], peroxisomal
VYM